MSEHGTFGPSAVLRAARFGMDRLAGLQDAADPRAALWERTIGDPRFLRALCVSNPGFCAHAEALAAKGGRPKRIRSCERTLYRTLARAVGRTDPCDAWAGVAVARFGAATAIRRCSQHVAVAPDLRPFAALLAALSMRPDFRRGARFALNPTLRGTVYQAPDGHRELPATPGVSALLRALDGPAAPYERWQERLASRLGPEAPSLLETCIDQGLLLGGIRLPPLFSTPWEALSSVELPARAMRPWARCVALLRPLAGELEAFEALEPAAIRTRIDAARQAIRDLYGVLEIAPPELPRTPFRLDVRLPFEVTLGPEIRRSAAKTLDAYTRFQHGYSLGPGWQKAGIERLQRAGGVHQLGDQTAPLRSDRVTERIGRWEALLRSDGHVPELTTASEHAAPLASLLITLAGGGGPSEVHGITDQATAPYARFATLLQDDGIHRWFHTELGRAAKAAGITVAALASPFPASPNTLAQPAFADAVVDPFGASLGAIDLRGAEIRLVNGTPLLVVPGHPRPISVFGFSAANLSTRVDRQLRQTSFAAEGARFSKPAALSFDAERDGCPAPAVRLVNGAIVRSRRTVLTEEQRGALVDDPIRTWESLAQTHGWPRWLTIRIGTTPELTVLRDSPLAVEAVLHGAPQGASIAIEEPREPSWLRFEEERFVSALAIPFVRPRHAWSAMDHRKPDPRPTEAPGRER